MRRLRRILDDDDDEEDGGGDGDVQVLVDENTHQSTLWGGSRVRRRPCHKLGL